MAADGGSRFQYQGQVPAIHKHFRNCRKGRIGSANALQCSAVWCGAVRCCAVHCGAVQWGAVRCSALQCNVNQHNTTQHNSPRCAALHPRVINTNASSSGARSNDTCSTTNNKYPRQPSGYDHSCAATHRASSMSSQQLLQIVLQFSVASMCAITTTNNILQ